MTDIITPIVVDGPALMLLLVTAGITVRVITGLGFYFIKRLEARMTGTPTRGGWATTIGKKARTTPIGSGGSGSGGSGSGGTGSPSGLGK